MAAEDEIEAPAEEAASAPEQGSEDVERSRGREEEAKGGRAPARTSPTNASSSGPPRPSRPPTPSRWGARGSLVPAGGEVWRRWKRSAPEASPLPLRRGR